MGTRVAIVFGPTGAVASAAARTAAEKGAKVVLAMRDTSKAIPGLDANTEKQKDFERVQADLMNPDSVREAAQKTGAKHAFIYGAHGASDHMRATIEALKSAGVDLVVFLSSFTVREDPRKVEPSDAIPYLHAQVEINLEEVYGPGKFVAVRPGSFSSNNVMYKRGIQEGEVKIMSPDATVDCIVPEDIGRVCGTVLAEGMPDQSIIYLYGPELIPQRTVVEIIAEALGKKPKITANSRDAAYQMYVEEYKFPAPFANYMANRLEMASTAGKGQVLAYPVSDAELLNVEKYSGRKATTFKEWVAQNKEQFTS